MTRDPGQVRDHPASPLHHPLHQEVHQEHLLRGEEPYNRELPCQGGVQTPVYHPAAPVSQSIEFGDLLTPEVKAKHKEVSSVTYRLEIFTSRDF